MSKINQQTAQQIIDRYLQGASTYELADEYGLWQTSICNLIRGHSWPQCRRPNNIIEIIKSRHEKGLFKQGMICHIEAPPLTSVQEDVIIGSMLGDGNIKCGAANDSFCKKQCKRFKNYLDWHLDALQPYGSKISPIYSTEKLIGGSKGVILERVKFEKHLAGYNFYTHQHPVFTELRKKWYPEGKKVVPSDLVVNEMRLAIWFFDDGCNSVQSRQATICTQSFTLEEVDFLCQKLSDFDLRPSMLKILSQYTGREMPILKFDSTSYDNLISLVKPYMLWDCFQHKVQWRRSLEQWEYSGKFTKQEALDIIEERKTKSAKVIAKERGVHVNTIYALVSGRSWGHLHKDKQ